MKLYEYVDVSQKRELRPAIEYARKSIALRETLDGEIHKVGNGSRTVGRPKDPSTYSTVAFVWTKALIIAEMLNASKTLLQTAQNRRWGECRAHHI